MSVNLGAVPDELATKRGQLLRILAETQGCVVAFSGGVDSAVVAQAACLALGSRAVAVTGVSASLASGELAEARRIAQLIGIRHEVLKTQEFSNPDYLENSPQRCFHCKTELYSHLAPLARKFGVNVLVNGANLDDCGDFRPGMNAAQQHGVRSPLIECSLNKAEVRQLAAAWRLPIWDKPASPCLSSRVAYGEQVTPQRVHMIDGAELHLRSLGLREVRVRYHKGDLARLEVPLSALERICRKEVREPLLVEFKRLGFKYITLDLEGFRSGSLNLALPLVQLNT